MIDVINFSNAASPHVNLDPTDKAPNCSDITPLTGFSLVLVTAPTSAALLGDTPPPLATTAPPTAAAADSIAASLGGDTPPPLASKAPSTTAASADSASECDFQRVGGGTDRERRSGGEVRERKKTISVSSIRNFKLDLVLSLF